MQEYAVNRRSVSRQPSEQVELTISYSSSPAMQVGEICEGFSPSPIDPRASAGQETVLAR